MLKFEEEETQLQAKIESLEDALGQLVSRVEGLKVTPINSAPSQAPIRG